MVPGDERYERFKHQSFFLHARGLMPPEMEQWERQLGLFERLTGKDSSKLDPQLVDRIHGELARAAMEQLNATGLLEEWLESWEARTEIATAPAFVETQESSRLSVPQPARQSVADVEGDPAPRSLADKLTELERAVQRFSEHVAAFRTVDEPPVLEQREVETGAA